MRSWVAAAVMATTPFGDGPGIGTCGFRCPVRHPRPADTCFNSQLPPLTVPTVRLIFKESVVQWRHENGTRLGAHRATPLAERRRAERLARVHRRHHPPGGPSRPSAPARRGHAARVLRTAGHAGRVPGATAAYDRAGDGRDDHPFPPPPRRGPAAAERLGTPRGLPLRQARPVRGADGRGLRGAGPARPRPRGGRTPGGLRPAHPGTAEVPRRDHEDHRRGTSAVGSGSGPPLAALTPQGLPLRAAPPGRCLRAAPQGRCLRAAPSGPAPRGSGVASRQCMTTGTAASSFAAPSFAAPSRASASGSDDEAVIVPSPGRPALTRTRAITAAATRMPTANQIALV